MRVNTVMQISLKSLCDHLNEIQQSLSVQQKNKANILTTLKNFFKTNNKTEILLCYHDIKT